MASNIQAGLVQGGLDEGQPAANERPVLVAGKDTATGAIVDIPITGGLVAVTPSVIPNPLPVSGTVTANQGTPNAGGAAGSWFVQGAAASGAAAAGNPVLVAGLNGANAIDLAVDSSGRQVVIGAAAEGAPVAGNPVYIGVKDGSANLAALRSNPAADGATSAFSALITTAQGHNYNGATWDRQRNNVDVTLLASASRTTTQTSADITTYNDGALAVYLDVTVNAAGSITLSIDEKDPASGKYVNLLTGLAIAATTGTTVYRIDPRTPAVANSIAQIAMPRVFRIVVTANLANAVTYSVGYTLKIV